MLFVMTQTTAGRKLTNPQNKMNEEKLKTLTLEELKKKQKTVAILAYTLSGIVLLLIISLVYNILTHKPHTTDYSFGALSLPCILLGNYLNKINEEIKSRNSQS
jgi:archaellum biogenesis protein FlaJ (TadC family)